MIGYEFTVYAYKELRNLPQSEQRRIVKKIKEYLSGEDPLEYAKKLQGVPGKVYRFRIGDYRVIFDFLGSKILIIRVGHRKEIYR